MNAASAPAPINPPVTRKTSKAPRNEKRKVISKTQPTKPKTKMSASEFFNGCSAVAEFLSAHDTTHLVCEVLTLLQGFGPMTTIHIDQITDGSAEDTFKAIKILERGELIRRMGTTWEPDKSVKHLKQGSFCAIWAAV